MALPVVFMGTPGYATPVLQALQAAGHDVRAVYTQPDRPAGRGRRLEPSAVKLHAEAHGLPVRQPSTWRSRDQVAALEALEPEVIVIAAYGKILPAPVLDVPRRGCLNVHPSLLPRYRGPSPVASALLAGDDVTGVTVMRLDEGMDTGPVLGWRMVAVEAADTAGRLTERLFREGARLLTEILPLWLEGSLEPVPQDESQATVTRRFTKEDGALDWTRPAAALWRGVRAFDPWPGAYTTWQGRLLKVTAARVAESADSDSAGHSGLVVPVDRASSGVVGVVAGDGSVLVLDEVQEEGRRRLAASDFVRGHPGFLGSVLPS